ncbi:O-acetyl-ADP-ribose deacetylase [Actinomarinicola tropica]|uniref:O-acetyl-ADP-ribose deacetylase n=1 Tax=Actinomarinicola tropica TaxID=2789776 RepID=A0A5Q2RHN9_9ACTN|nr:O-acetyl-ADP-ribose deacetylase [Actinomarinicola tropica]QGG96368.1 O-acetyl-ADP-ribose deacetylase [Actinomarinicola tropica]
MARLAALRRDITTLEVDAVVNAANSSLMGGGGVDGAIHRAGGPAILEECRAVVDRQGRLPTGEAVITTAGRMPARHVIHTVGPVWTGDDPSGHDALLASCYRTALALAAEHGLASVAFPAISTGIYGFPKDRAAGIAVGTVTDAVRAHPSIEAVVFACFSDADVDRYRRLGVPEDPDLV